MFCQNCGKELPEGAGFCPECGAKVAESVTPAPTPETVVEVAPSTSETGKAESMASETAAATAAASGREKKIMNQEETLQEKYFNFQGRLNRKRYIWRSIVLSLVTCILAAVLAALLGDSILSLVVCSVISIAGFVAGLSLCVRRLHDLNRSGLFWLLFFIPIVDFFFAIYVIFFKGTEGDNQYGPDPLAR